MRENPTRRRSRDIVKDADELQKKVDAIAEKFIRDAKAWGTRGRVRMEARRCNQVQNLLDDLDGLRLHQAHTKKKAGGADALVNDDYEVRKCRGGMPR